MSCQESENNLLARQAARLEEQRRVAEALRALASSSPRQAPEHVERELLAAFRDAAGTRSVPRRRSAVWAAAAAAALLPAAVWLVSLGPARPEPEPPPEFIPLATAPAPELPGDLYVARIQASRAALVAAGLPLHMVGAGEPVHAEVVLTLDGTPRAIRILK